MPKEDRNNKVEIELSFIVNRHWYQNSAGPRVMRLNAVCLSCGRKMGILRWTILILILRLLPVAETPVDPD